jgi:mannitol-1-/sugar-/sorbitol-6-phosphatase
VTVADLTFAARAFLIDMDGTLVDSLEATDHAWTTWAAEYGQDAAAVVAVYHGRRTEDTVAEFLPPADRAEATARVLEIAQDTRGVKAIAGAAELLRQLRPGTWAIVTSADVPLMTARMRAAGLPIPGVVVTSEDVEDGKPDPQGFIQAAGTLGVPIEDCVVIEDSAAGVTAGKAAGALVVGLTADVGGLDHADVVVGSLAALRVTATEVGYEIRVLSSVRGLAD